MQSADRFHLGLAITTGIPGFPEVRFNLDVEDQQNETIAKDLGGLSDFEYGYAEWLLNDGLDKRREDEVGFSERQN